MTSDQREVAIKARIEKCRNADGGVTLSKEDLMFVLAETGKWHIEMALEFVRAELEL